MHETVFGKKIIDEAKNHGDVKAISIELGELAHVPPEELLACLQELVTWDIESAIVPAKVKCTCGFEGHPKILERGHDYFFIECPECGDIPELVDGKEIKLVNVTIK
jgi:Zn finger protein HypA/HybF involved in hydrogenase expression